MKDIRGRVGKKRSKKPAGRHFEMLEPRMVMSAAPVLADLDFHAGPPAGAGRPEFVQNELLVAFHPGAREHDIRGIYHAHGLQEIERLYQGDLPQAVRRVSVPEQVAEAVKTALARNPHIVYAEPNFVAATAFAPNDSLYSYQWNLHNGSPGGINAEAAWAIATGTGVTVAVLDTGVAYANHQDSTGTYYIAPDLVGTRFVAGYDFINNDPHPNDDHSHGTHVAGTIAQATNNSRGVAGIAFNSSVMPVKVLGRDGTGSHAAIANGIKWAADRGAHVINLSLGSASGSRTLRDAVAYAYGKGATIVAATGNDGVQGVSFPAAYDDFVIAVGASRFDGRLASYSNYGSSVDIVAPGGDMSVDQNRDGYPDGILQNTFNPSTKDTSKFAYYFFQGTSMAAAHVSGAAALVVSQLLSTAGSAHPDQVRQVLQSTAVDAGPAGVDIYYGHGILNVGAALQAIVPVNLPPIALNDVATTSQGTPVTIHVLANDSDPDGDAIHIVSVSPPASGTVTNHDNGTLTYTPNASFVGVDVFTYTIADPAGATATASVTITVEGVMTSPTLRVARLDATVASQRNQWRAEVAIGIADAGWQAVAGAAVNGVWSDGRTFQGTTDSTGQLTAVSRWLNRNTQASITLSVTHVAYSNWTFDGGSGTSILVHRDGTTTMLGASHQPPHVDLTPLHEGARDDVLPDDEQHPPSSPEPPTHLVPPVADKLVPDTVPPVPRWQNPQHPLDVIGNGRISPADVLVVINHLNTHGVGPVPDPLPGDSIWHYLDTNGDDLITALDALLVINFLNQHGSITIPQPATENPGNTPDEPADAAFPLELLPEGELIELTMDAVVAQDELPWEQALEAWEQAVDRISQRIGEAIERGLADRPNLPDLFAAEDSWWANLERPVNRGGLLDPLSERLESVLDLVSASLARWQGR